MINELKKALHFAKHNFEALIWLLVIIIFAFSPTVTTTHFTLCPLSLAGFEYCPGCGLGRSIILLLHGNIAASIKMHPLSIIAFLVLITRIVIVFKNYSTYKKAVLQNSNA